MLSSEEKKRKLVNINISRKRIELIGENGGCGVITSILSYAVSAQMR